MKKAVFLTLILALSIVALNIPVSASHTRVNGYYKSNGTYVNGYSRTSPNTTKFDNFSTKGNINPYTFKSGTVNPYKSNSTSFPSKSYRTYKTKY